MSDIAIRVEGLSKLYRIGKRERYYTLRDTLTNALYAPFQAVTSALNGRRSSVSGQPSDNTIWALKDVSFEIKRGEVVGVIGRNGAGKSTLLKILSRITEPTEGSAEIHGRVGSLLEVGTGFHPELTGRENIYLNGAILGMKKAEIDRKFDEIVAFAEVEKFIDTPVKHYSSGMAVRLAFAVAAHLEPEILLVDEVLAVGDAAFQKKCIGKMGDVAKAGRTVLFVSHNMGPIERLCSRCILLEEGVKKREGAARDVISTYLRYGWRATAVWQRSGDHPWPEEVAFQSARTLNKAGCSTDRFAGDEPVGVEIEYVVRRSLPACQIGVRINDGQGITVMYTSECDKNNVAASSKDPGRYCSYFEIPGRLLTPGNYALLVAAHAPMEKTFEVLEGVVNFEVTNAGSLTVLDGRLGFVAPQIPWKVLRTEGV